MMGWRLPIRWLRRRRAGNKFKDYLLSVILKLNEGEAGKGKEEAGEGKGKREGKRKLWEVEAIIRDKIRGRRRKIQETGKEGGWKKKGEERLGKRKASGKERRKVCEAKS